MRTERRLGFAFLTSLLAVALLWPASALAQRRAAVVRAPVTTRRVVVVGIGGFGYPRYVYYDAFYDPWYGPYYSPWYALQYPRGPYGPYPPGYYGRVIDDRTASLRLDAKPKQAEVFVDGYLSGIVDDYDGIFQRLHVRPGEHELVLYLRGYKSIHQNLSLNFNSSQKITLTMVRLEPGETEGPRPVPANPDEPSPTELRRPEPPRFGPYGPPMGPRQPGEPGGPPPEPPSGPPTQAGPPSSGGGAVEPPREVPPASQNFGTFSIRVQPSDADVLVDGEKWMTPAGQERLVIQLSDGKHRVEVRKEGFEKFSTEISVRRGETTTLNVSLLRSSAGSF